MSPGDDPGDGSGDSRGRYVGRMLYGSSTSVHRSFWIPLAIWTAFVARCKREGVKPTVQVRALVTDWAIADDEGWTD